MGLKSHSNFDHPLITNLIPPNRNAPRLRTTNERLPNNNAPLVANLTLVQFDVLEVLVAPEGFAHACHGEFVIADGVF
jgi:hypothetical protein